MPSDKRGVIFNEPTLRIVLEAVHAEAIRALAVSDTAFAGALKLGFGKSWAADREEAMATLKFLTGLDVAPPWGTYVALASADRRLVGMAAFKASPDEQRVVEIAYMTLAGEQAAGVATHAARGLLEIAAKHDVAVVRAHTLPERNASVRVLEKLDFALIGEVLDPEDGRVWRWEKRTSG